MKCLVVLAKAPRPGFVKTRLVPPLTSEAAAELAEAMLLDALAQYATIGVAVRLYLAGSWDVDQKMLVGTTLRPQSTGSLGTRLCNACQDARVAGARQIVVIGTDHPTLPSTWIARAFDHTERTGSAVIGPTADGGFYLVGLHPYAPGAFDGTFSHERVFEETHARLANGWQRVRVLPPWYDVDTVGDLDRLRRDLVQTKACRHTRRVLSSLDQHHLASLPSTKSA